MKPPPFGYHSAGSVDEAVALLTELGDEAKLLAGGQSLVPLLNLRLARPEHLIDINGLGDLASVEVNGAVEIGAMVRHSALERSDVVRRVAPLLSAAARFIGHSAIRNRGTIGGSVSHGDPAAELPAALRVLDGEIVARSARGTRTIDAADFFDGFLTTTLEADELVTAIRLPAIEAGTGWSFGEFSRRSGDFAIVGTAVTLRLGVDGRVADARIAFSGVAGVPVRADTAERLLVGESPSEELWTSAAEQAGAELSPPEDLHGTAAYRRRLAATLAQRALSEAWARTKGAA
jgi:carbon-monoxide dehydrogenase medium subunit